MLILAKATWCGHCRSFAPIWEQFKKKYSSVLDLREVDADKDKDVIQELEISGFPTILLLNGHRVEFDGPRTMAGLEDFVKQNLNPHIKDDLKKYRSSTRKTRAMAA